MQSDEENEEFSFFESFYEKSQAEMDEKLRRTTYFEEYVIEEENDEKDENFLINEEEEENEIEPCEFNGMDQCIEDLLNFPHYHDDDPNLRGYDANEIMHFKGITQYLTDFLNSNQDPIEYGILIESDAMRCIADLLIVTSEPEIEESCITVLSYFLYKQDIDEVGFSTNPDFFYRLLSLADKEIDFSNRKNFQKVLNKAQYIICRIISLKGAKKNIPDDFYPEAFRFFNNGAMFLWFIRLYVTTVEVDKTLLPDIIEMITSTYLKASQAKYSKESKFLDIQKDAIIALRAIIPQFPLNQESYEVLNKYLNPQVLQLIIEAKFIEQFCADVFACLLLLIRRDVHVDFILDESLLDLDYKLKGIPCKERTLYLFYAFRLVHSDLYDPENKIYFFLSELLRRFKIDDTDTKYMSPSTE